MESLLRNADTLFLVIFSKNRINFSYIVSTHNDNMRLAMIAKRSSAQTANVATKRLGIKEDGICWHGAIVNMKDV
jgi:hypothetical protein